MSRKVSIIIPVYNIEKYIGRCIESVINQTYKNLEIILVDDGSPDNSREICDEYALNDNRIKVVHKENGGVSSARNKGLEIATGDYIGFVDGDDYIAPEMYEALVKNIEETNADISVCGFNNQTSNGDFIRYDESVGRMEFEGEEQIVNLLQNKYYCCSCWDRIFKRDVIENEKFNLKITNYEDLLFLYLVTKKSQKTVFCSTPYYYYCYNEGSASTSPFDDKKTSMLTAFEIILNDVKENMGNIYSVALCEYIRTNLFCAKHSVISGYKNEVFLKKIRSNIKKNLHFYLKSYAAKGYKIQAFALSVGWWAFKLILKIRK